MRSEWKEYSIEELKAQTKNAIAMGPFGSRIKAENFVSIGVPVIKGGNLHEACISEDKFDFLTTEKADELKSSQAFPGDIVITHRGTIGQVSIIPYNSKYEKYIVSQSQLKISLNLEIINPYYLNYFLRSHIGQHRLLANASQVGVPAIAKASTSVKSIVVPCPNLKVQNNIVDILKSLDDKITLNREINQTLEQMAQALFKSWFVDFDPVIDNALDAGFFDATTNSELASLPPTLIARAELRKTARASDDFQTLPDHIRQLFPSAFEDSQEPSVGINGWMPTGWETTKLENLICIKHGYAFKGEYFSENATSDILLTPGNVKVGGGFKSDKYKFYLGPLVSDYIFKAGDIFVNMTDLSKASDTLGYPSVVPNYQGLTFHHNQRLGKVSFSDHPCATKEFIYQTLCSNNYRNSVLGSATGTTVKHTAPKKILSHILVCSGVGSIEKIFNEQAGALMKKTYENESSSRVLSKLRDTLLPKLISGELRLDSPEVEQAKALVGAG